MMIIFILLLCAVIYEYLSMCNTMHKYYIYTQLYTHVICIWKIICHKKGGPHSHLDQPLKTSIRWRDPTPGWTTPPAPFGRSRGEGWPRYGRLIPVATFWPPKWRSRFHPWMGHLKHPKRSKKVTGKDLVMMKNYSTIDVLILTELLRILSVVKVKNLNCITFKVQSMSSLKDGTCNKNTIRKIRRTHDWWDSFWTYWCNKKTGFSTITKDCSWLLGVFYVCGISKLSNPGLLGTWSSRCVSHVKWLSWRRLQASHDVHESDREHRDFFDTCLVVESYFGVSYRVNNSWPLLWYIIITHPSDWIRKKYTLSPRGILGSFNINRWRCQNHERFDTTGGDWHEQFESRAHVTALRFSKWPLEVTPWFCLMAWGFSWRGQNKSDLQSFLFPGWLLIAEWQSPIITCISMFDVSAGRVDLCLCWFPNGLLVFFLRHDANADGRHFRLNRLLASLRHQPVHERQAAVSEVGTCSNQRRLMTFAKKKYASDFFSLVSCS